ncbi:AAA family ATPase [Thermodesulfobacteriota bacterium]
MSHYTSFFHLKENPFVLTPDPKYLYLGQRHREVLSHLLYGINEDKGFMVVVGEVGTGKTTLCRAFINQLMKQNMEVGLIYNPAMTDLELLQAINREFKISSDHGSKGKLIDELNEFLLKANGEGRKVILIIDEAQNLHPLVMEQLRLISNLETETGKLIQIILVGQPELERILAKKEMRQLDQRIVVRGLLGPFTPDETMAYIHHRLRIATMDHADSVAAFSGRACRLIYKLSCGIPRVINILADRSLLVAYTLGKRKIDRNTVKSAHKDLERSRYRSPPGRLSVRWQIAALFFLSILTFLGWFYLNNLTKNHGKPKKVITAGVRVAVTPAVVSPIISTAVRSEIRDEKPEPDASPEEKLEEVMQRFLHPLENLSKEENWQLVLRAIHDLWDGEKTISSGTTLGGLPQDSSLKIWEVNGNINLLKSLNYPAIVELKRPDHDSGVYAILKELNDETATLIGQKEEVIPKEGFDNYWYGHAFIVWKDFESLPRMIAPGASSRAVAWLQHNLKHLHFFEGEPTGYYDYRTQRAVISLQKAYNLGVDGVVGPETKLWIYSRLNNYSRPLLRDQPKKTDKDG